MGKKIVTVRIEIEEIESESNHNGEHVVTLSDYARFFDESSALWTKDSNHNLVFLRVQQTYVNDLLRRRGYVFLNEVYDMLGIPRTKAGQVVGWLYDEGSTMSDNYIDFGIYSDRNKDFVNGLKNTALLDFNVDGCIIDKLQ